MALYDEYVYDDADKENCWYKKICNANLCGLGDENFCARHYKMHYLTAKAMLEGKERFTTQLQPEPIDLGAFKRLAEIREGINSFVADGKNLLIYSQNCGNGKTEWAKKLLLSWFNSIWHTSAFKCRGLFIFMPRFIQSSKDSINKENPYFTYVMENIYDADLVVFDEINYKAWTNYEMELLFNIISRRISEGKSNIFTTNYSLDAIAERLGPRLASRVIGGSEIVEFKGLDRRAYSKIVGNGVK